MKPGLLEIEGLDRETIELYLRRAKDFQSHGGSDFKKLDTLRGKMLVNLFFENSTRTRTSFEIAAKRLGADTVEFSSSGSVITLNPAVAAVAGLQGWA